MEVEVEMVMVMVEMGMETEMKMEVGMEMEMILMPMCMNVCVCVCAELRELVGGRYRSLLSCADAISSMSVSLSNVEKELPNVQLSLTQLGAHSLTHSQTALQTVTNTLTLKRKHTHKIRCRNVLFTAADRALHVCDGCGDGDGDGDGNWDREMDGDEDGECLCFV